MIKAHPTDPMLCAFAADELPLPLAVGLSAHCELCPDCAARLKTFEEELAQQYLAAPAEPELAPRDDVALDAGFDAMLADILAQPLSEPTHDQPRAQSGELEVAGHAYRLPRVLARYRSPKWRHIGAIRQQSLPLDEMGARASLLHIEAGGRIPEHTHQGYELTLLLAGTIEDGDTLYKAGDFIWRDASHSHSPHTPDGCLCYTVQDAPVQFTKGLSRLLNGISQHLY
ncbi:transcriptional regulator [Aeromonas sp. YN13HZO-058]|uniref:ChrR family anti-sigma-E factor n=1 Tax=Aeromonas sp. YN13HZO-058 TaxID=1921564 RepID=UPI000946FDFC|nr:ChrR family anti-sigma-E factor [Aeromonas sp. YN13HZO-058]OLF20820.1 transcriptional regulator [Aeromonas sp. YN13HZO-058]BBT78455.1 transcriptional regulator [Aeromonas veronii]